MRLPDPPHHAPQLPPTSSRPQWPPPPTLRLLLPLLLPLLLLAWAQGSAATSSTLTVNITGQAPYLQCNYFTLSYQVWCSGPVKVQVAVQADCLRQFLPLYCLGSPLYRSMQCPPPGTSSTSGYCQGAWSGDEGNVDPVCLVLSSNSSDLNQVLTCDVQVSGSTALYGPSDSSWPTWKLVLVICGSVIAFGLVASAVVAAVYCGLHACCRCCRCCGYEPGEPKSHLVVPQVVPLPLVTAKPVELTVWDRA